MMQDTRYGIQDTGYRVHDGYKMHGTRVPVSCTLHRVSCIILLLCASCILHPASAQLYPVQSTLQITPPYSLTLADYVAPGSEKVALNIFLADVNRPELSVRLRLRIEGVGIRIETKAEYLPEPMMISGGVPLRLIGADLVDYFDPRNLNFSGITQREYEQKAALPEGLYQFTFEVIEYNRGVKISNSATVMAWLILNDPPLINLPKDNDKIRIQSPQQVIFQWTPRHTGSPNSAFSTEYEFRLVEVWPSTRNPNDAILTSPAIFETTTAASTLIYGPAETPLEPGRRYAFRIKAKSIVGVDELNLFKNNGYSQVSTFVYGDACTLPTGIQAEVISSSKIGFAWDTQDNHTGYNIKYRLANTPNAAWYTNTSALNDIEINSLQPATTYEYQVAAACGSYDSEYSPVATVTTNEAQAITYSCGLPLNPFDLDPSQLIESLKTGDVIQAGDFDVKLTEVSGSNGIFTGKGVIEVPFFNKARLQASFSGISVNKELRMVAGSMNITGGGVEVIPAGVMDMMDELTEALALADSALNLVESNLPQPFDPHSFVADKEVKIPGTITSVTKGANGGVVVTASNGTEQTIPAGGTTAITDSNGNGYLIDSKGNIHPTTAAIASAAARREYNLNVNFAKATDTRFGFDAKKHDALLTTYEHVKDTYYASWKSIATGQTDNALALLEGTNVDKTKIHFEQSGQAVTANTQSPSPNTQVLNIKGIADGVQESLVALYTPADTTQKEQVLGKLNVVTYNQIDKHVVIVPVNGNTFDKFGAVAILQDSLNKIYNQGIVNWTVELKAGITVEGISPFEDGGTGLLSNFTSHMKKVINAYKENTTPDTYYLFLVSNPQDPSTLGVMPRSKEYGFIFADKHSTLPEVARTIAHELGHGAFNLHHTFMEPSYTITKGTTDNLMDYPAGPKLYKYQWDKIRYPDIVVGVFESDEEGQYSQTFDEYIKSKIAGLESLTGLNYFSVIHCDACDSNESNSTSDYSISELLAVPVGYSGLEGKALNGGAKLTRMQFAERANSKCLVLYYEQSNESVLSFSSQATSLSNEFDFTKRLYFYNGTATFNCNSFLGEWSQVVCSLNANNIFSTEKITIDYYNKLFESISNCLLNLSPHVDLVDSEIKDLLTTIQSQVRSGQQVEFVQNDVVFKLSSTGDVVEIENPQSESDINNGKWNETGTDIKMRLEYDQQGTLQFTAIGIRENLELAKKADLKSIAQNMLLKSNTLFKKYQVKEGTLTPNDVNASFDTDGFPDGKKIDINEAASFFKIISEAAGIGLSFLKTAEIEKPVYLEGEDFTIKAPPIVTGTLESAGMVVTDITSATSMIYDLVTDEQARNSAKNGFVEIGNKIVDDPNQLFPILGEVILEEFTSSSSAQFSELTDNKTNEGRKNHIITKTSVRTASSVFESGKFLVKLPQMASTVAFKMGKAKAFLKFKTIDNIASDLFKQFEDRLKNLKDGGQKFLDDFKDASDDIRRRFLNKPELLDAWKKLDGAEVDASFRKNPDILEKVNDLYDPEKFQLPSDRPIVDGKKLDGDFKVKTRDGLNDVYFDKNGFPDFDEYSLGNNFSYKPDGKVLNGSSSDLTSATSWLKTKYAGDPNVKIVSNGSNIDVTINGTKNTYTWHHYQDGKTLMPVLTSVHTNVAHTGGAAIIQRGLEGMFSSPF